MKTQRPSDSEFLHISEVLKQALSVYRKNRDAAILDVCACWSNAVGPAIAENTSPHTLKNDLLIVYVTSSVWNHQLQFLKSDIIRKVNAALDKETIRDIRFKIGPVHP